MIIRLLRRSAPGPRNARARLARVCGAAVVLAVASVGVAATGELRLSKLERSMTLNAIARADNGKVVGMAATLGNSYLRYRAFSSRLDLRYAGQFKASLMPPANAKRYLNQMDGAAVYDVQNADEFLSENAGRLFLPPNHRPTFVTLKTDRYVDGGKATWICILSAPSLQAFYETRTGHERCDAFR